MIYIITHKKFKEYFEDKLYYKILHVGMNDDFDSEYICDNTGNNISYKNKNYCELTGIYWLWKNSKENQEDIIGVVHYRRYFTSVAGDFLYTYFNIKPKVLDYDIIVSKLEKNDIILPTPEKIFRTVRQSYCDVHYEEDLDLTRQVISNVCPDYLDAFDEVMNSHKYYYANMMICKKKTFDDYAKWLFSVLFNLEPLIDINKYSDNYQKRVFGFLSERLLQVWVVKNELKISEQPVFNTEEKRDTIFKKNRNRIKKLLLKMNLLKMKG